jgi:hypothetical protein
MILVYYNCRRYLKMEFTIGDVVVVGLVLGIVELLRYFGLGERVTRVATLFIGAFFFGLAEAISQGIVPEDWIPFITVAVKALAATLAAMGFYEFSQRVFRVDPR